MMHFSNIPGRWLLGLATLLAAAVYLSGPSSPPAPESPAAGPAPAGARAATITLARPHWSAARVEESIRASDRVKQDLRGRGIADIPAFIAARLREIQVSEADARAFHAANPLVFGHRSFEASRAQVEELVRFQQLRAELGLPAPDNGLRYPGS